MKHKPVALSTRINPTKMLPKLERICVYVQCSQMASCKAHSAQNVLILTDMKPSLSNDLGATKATTQTASPALVMWLQILFEYQAGEECTFMPSKSWVARRNWKWSLSEQNWQNRASACLPRWPTRKCNRVCYISLLSALGSNQAYDKSLMQQVKQS